ncbi:MAG: glycosyltransferase family 2 protein [Bacteroidota bacterium]
MRYFFTPPYIIEKYNLNETEEQSCHQIHHLYSFLKKGSPEVSVVIPAFNEEQNILKTLYTLVNNQCSYNVEIIVVNNNSIDRTKELVIKTGVICILEKIPGITAARNAGLNVAKGKYILNADADTIYPINWIEEMVRPMAENTDVALVYGNFSFIPTAGTPRWVYFFYEYLADLLRWYNRTFNEEAVNVYGFNSGFKRDQGIAVNGFEHPLGTNEDGWLAVKLRENKFGNLYHVKNIKALVWTADRRIQMDGGLLKGIIKRMKRFMGLSTEPRTDL